MEGVKERKISTRSVELTEDFREERGLLGCANT